MKNLKLAVIIFLATILVSHSQAQNCTFSSMTKGKVMSYDNYNKKGKLTAKTVTTFLDQYQDSTGAAIFLVNRDIFNAKGEELSSVESTMSCKMGSLLVDAESIVDPEGKKEFKNVKMEIVEGDMVYPDKLELGQELPDFNIDITTEAMDGTIRTYTILIKKRKVESKESITTPAGTYDCYKISYVMDIVAYSFMSFTVSEYISEGVGKIKTETFNKKGKLVSSSLLVELSE